MNPLTSPQNPLVKHLAKLVRDRSYRHSCQTVVIEGRKCVEEITRTIAPLHILYTDPALLPLSLNSPSHLISPSILGKIVLTENPEGIIAEVPLPKEADLTQCSSILVLDRITDPGNLGTLLRTALAFGWDAACLLPGCCDPFNDKALRAAKGATFSLPLSFLDWPSLQKLPSIQWLAADLEGTPPEKIPPSSKRALILGNEAQGIDPRILNDSLAVTLPMSTSMESLNVSVAGGILLYILRGDHV